MKTRNNKQKQWNYNNASSRSLEPNKDPTLIAERCMSFRRDIVGSEGDANGRCEVWRRAKVSMSTCQVE
jgi:hypothetical protein